MRTDHVTLNFQEGDLLCTTCRKKLCEVAPEGAEHSARSSDGEQEPISDDVLVSDTDEPMRGRSTAPQQSDSLHDIFISLDHELSILNESLTVLGESPVVKRKAGVSVKYSKNKVRSVESAVKRKLELITGTAIEESEEEDSPDTEMIAQLKEKFRMSTKTSEKMQVLTVLPKSWSIRKTEHQFQATNYMVRKAKQLVEEKGIMSTQAALNH